MPLRNIVYALLIATGLLLVPLTASVFVDGWLWTGSDYVFAWVLFSFLSLAFTFVGTSAKSLAYKLALGLAALATFLLVWVSAAVQIIGDDNPANMLYLGVIAIGFFGAITTRLAPRPMSSILFAMAVAQMLVPVAALFIDPTDFSPGVARVFVLNAVFAMLWAGSGLLLQQADSATSKSSQRPD